MLVGQRVEPVLEVAEIPVQGLAA